MDKLYTTTEAANYLGVSCATLRLWDKSGKLIPAKTDGGHRRYSEVDLNRHLRNNKSGCNYQSLYEHLCRAYEISEIYSDEDANAIKEIRDRIGLKLLSQIKSGV